MTLDNLRRMIEEYKDYVVYIDYPHREIIKILTLRDEIEDLLLNLEKRGTDLEADKVRLETFDTIIRKKMKMVYRKLTASLNPLPYREERKIPRSHWWWYLDELLKEKRVRARKRWLIRGGIAAVALLAAYIILTKIVPQPKQSVIYQGEARELYQEGELDEAIEIYKKAQGLEPDDSSIPLMLGMIYEDKGLLDRANDYFERARLLSSQKIDFYNSRGMIYFQMGKLDKAVLDAKKALELDSNSAFSHFLLGNIYEMENKIAEAILEYQIVSDLDQNPQLTVMARFKMGMIMQRAPLRSLNK
ncbi:MAG TPA: tetratricopeptide repeat protein [Candidatus Aerophobetes bacterium]|uniref:Tetratricopeptide repeat protein n=1 Tax=Aerophobetes bacterium TaxID=2030807 RepID=A0A7C1R9P4_UNCAE|nr:tetratricopeptide repeat protein [Candidatus Aerophobetes bacterium]